jgi:hypothetical protein
VGRLPVPPVKRRRGLAAERFLETLGTFRPNVTILDLEEGTGDQAGRQHDWLSVMANDPARDWTYSGDYFARTHGLSVDWIAAYQKREPTTAHRLWQFTDAHSFPGIGSCDASVFLGTVDDLIALTSNTAPPAPTPAHTEDDMAKFHYAQDTKNRLWLVNLGTTPKRVHVFVDADYEVGKEGHSLFVPEGAVDIGPDDAGAKRQGQKLDAKGEALYGIA